MHGPVVWRTTATTDRPASATEVTDAAADAAVGASAAKVKSSAGELLRLTGQ